MRTILRAFQRVWLLVLESPVAESDARELLASWRVGLWLATLVAFLAAAAFGVGAAYFSGERPFPQLVARAGIGAVVVAALQAATAAFLTLAVPLRAAGLLEGPRWRGYFEQIVASGIEPWRYFAGRALVLQAFVLLSLLATLPVVLVFALVDPPPLGPVLEGYALLAIYAELLLATVLGLGVLVHELFAVLATISLGLLAGVVALAPVPSALAALSPLRGIAAPLILQLPDEDATFLELFYGPPRPFGIEVPLLPWAAGLALFFGTIAATSCFFGPLHAFAPGFNGFGAVVLPGDRKRAAFRRIRPLLQRRAELAFFFENRGPVLRELAPWVRLHQIGATVGGLGTLGVATFLPLPVLRQLFGQRPDEDVLALVAGLIGAFALVGPWFLMTSRTDARTSLRLGRLEVPLVLADLLAYALIAVWIAGLLLHELAPLALVAAPRRIGSGFALLRVAGEWTAILCVAGFTALLVQKLVGLRTWSRDAGVIAGTLLVGAAQLSLLALDPRDLRDSDERSVVGGRASDEEPAAPRSEDENARALAALQIAFPLRMALLLDAGAYRDVRLPASGPWRWLAYNGFWVIYPALDVLLVLAVARLVQVRRREAHAEAGAATEAARAPPSGEKGERP